MYDPLGLVSPVTLEGKVIFRICLRPETSLGHQAHGTTTPQVAEMGAVSTYGSGSAKANYKLSGTVTSDVTEAN